MQSVIRPNDIPRPTSPGDERRGKPRVAMPFLSTVFGVSTDGHTFRAVTFIDDLSASGVRFRLRQEVGAGAELLVVIHLAGLPETDGPRPHVFFEGEVRRVETLADGYVYGVTSKRRQLRYLKSVAALCRRRVFRFERARKLP